MSYRKMPTLIALSLILWLQNAVYSYKDNSLTAKDLLETIAPTYKQAKLPPGFPSLHSINTDKFDYKTSGDDIKVSAKLEKPVVMFPDYVTISSVEMNFTFNKKKPKNTAWGADVKGLWAIGSTILHVNITPNGTISGAAEKLELREIVSQLMKKDLKKNIGIDITALTLKNVKIKADILDNMSGLNLAFVGLLDHNSLNPIPIKIVMTKYSNSKPQLYSVIQFENISPEKVLKKLLNQKTLNIPFMAHMLAGSSLFLDNKDIFGLAFSYHEVYYYKENTISSTIIESVLQSHIPVGVTLLFPLNLSKTKLASVSDTVKIAFVINNSSFDLLIDKKDKIPVSQVLPILSKEFETTATDTIPNVMTDLNDAFTTHLSFDSTSTMFSIFVRLTETVDLVKDLLRIKVTHLVLQRQIGLDDKNEKWKVAAKGIYTIGSSKLKVQYSELSNETGQPYGLTGIGDELSLEDILSEFDPDFYPDGDSQEMIENTEIESLKIHKVRIYSRVPRTSGTPHILVTGYTNLPEFEKDIQIALLLLYKRKKWRCKWAASLKHSPLSNIIQAFTGFDSRNLKLLHNGHILTTIISSPLPSYTLLPPHIITTPLLRLPVKKALTLIALLRFPDNCGDDKMCESAAELLDPSKIYTVKGVISMNGFRLRSKIRYDLNFSRDVKGVNSTLQFTIGNNSKLDIITSLKLPRSDLVFDGFIHILKTGQFQLEMASRRKRWVEPFKMKSIVFENLKLLTTYETGINLDKTGINLDKLKLEGKVLLGTPGNGDEIETLLTLNYNPNSPYSSSFYGNYTDVKLDALLTAFSIDAKLPGVLVESDFPTGLMLSYSGYRDGTIPSFNLHGEINIFGRLLNCHVFLPRDGNLRIVTENSPAPVIFAKGLIIIQADSKTKLRGPTIVANIDSYKANVTVNGFVKVLGIESDANIALEDKGVIFSVSGKLMDYKETKLTASSLDSTDSFQVYGCLEDLAEQVQLLLLEIVDKAANQSIVNMKKADQNYLSAQKHYELIDREEIDIRSQRDRARVFYEEHLLAYGRFEVKANDTCSAPKCLMKCFGCPKLQKCCRLDIFGHCISCSTWKSCCWKNINPLCIAKHDGCHVIKTVAERDLTEKEAQLIQQRIILDNLEQHVTKTEVNKGKHKAVLEAATDAKQIVEEDSSPGLNAHDAIRNFGTPFGWAKINSVCYNTSIEQAATGCMKFQISTNLFGKAEKNITIWSCLKGDLVTEVTESLANYIFPKIIDTSADSITEVAAQLNSAEIDKLKISSSAPEIVNDLLVPSNVEKPDGEINTMPAPNKQGDGEQYSMPAPSKQGQGELYTMSAPSKQGDGELLHDALGDGTQYANDQVNAQAPPNSIDANGKPQVTLIDTSRLGDYVRQPNEDEEDSSASGEEGTDEELKELYDNETRVDINNANSAKISNSNSGDDDMLAKEIVEQEEVDEENNEDTEKNEKSAKKKKNKKNKKNNRKLRIFQQKPAAEYTNTEFNSPVQNKNDSTLFNSNMSSQTNWYPPYPPYPPYPSRNFTQNKTYYTPANSYATQNQNQSVYQNPAYNFNAEMLKYNPSSYYPNGNQATSQETPYSIYNRNQYTSSPSTAKPGLNFNGNQPVPFGTNTGNYTSSNQAATSVEPFNRTGNPFFTGYTRAVIDTLNGATQQLNTPFAATYGVNSVPQANTYSNSENDASNQKSSVPKTRKRRSLETTIRSRLPLTLFHSPKSRILFSNPFWDIKSDRSVTSTRSNIPLQPHRQKLMKNVIHKRWKIPDNSNGRCHIFHQLIAICKDMAETIVMLEKSIKDSRSKFQEEDKDVYLELFETEDFLVDAAKRINVSNGLMIEASKTLDVVRQGVNIWSKRCSNEFEWQNEAGVQTWLQAMDLRIQQLGGYGVYRFLENLFHAFEALFEALTYSNSSTAKDALTMLQRIRRISNSFDKIFRNKLSVMKSRVYADRILKELANLRKDTTFC